MIVALLGIFGKMPTKSLLVNRRATKLEPPNCPKQAMPVPPSNRGEL
jgi:hypothetical protein